MYTYRVTKSCDSLDNRFNLESGEVVTGNGNFVGKVGVLKDGVWDLVDRESLQRVRSGIDRRRGSEDRRAKSERRC
jgi:hypothetical protein